MFNGWLSFAGTEILNDDRVRAYAAEMVPTLQLPTTCNEDERNLAQILADPPYAFPRLDEAPWVDEDDPDTTDFCGALTLSVTGLTDNTREATLVENTRDGGSILGHRLRTREVRVTALLIGATEASVQAGKRWLSAALAGGCDPCEPDDLCFLVGTNADSIPVGDYTTSTLQRSVLLGSPATWNNSTGVFKPSVTSDEVRTPNAPYPLPCDEVFWHWNLSAASAGTTVVIETLGESGVTNSVTWEVPTTGGTVTISDRGVSERRSWSRLRVTSAPGESVTITNVEMEYRVDPDDDVCFQKYARQLHRVRCITGPVTIEEYQPSAGAMEKVEFAFVAEAPHVYGLAQEVISVTGREITSAKPGADAYAIDKVLPVCSAPRVPTPVTDPDCPVVPVPPRRLVEESSCAPEPTDMRSYALEVPDSAIPMWNEAVPILRIKTAGAAARRVQVRFLPKPLDVQIFSDLDPCSACGEFVIDYIPPHSTFVLNGIEQRAYVEFEKGLPRFGGHLLSGLQPGTLFSWPVLTCGTGYLTVIDVASTTIESFSLSLATREFS